LDDLALGIFFGISKNYKIGPIRRGGGIKSIREVQYRNIHSIALWIEFEVGLKFGNFDSDALFCSNGKRRQNTNIWI